MSGLTTALRVSKRVSKISAALRPATRHAEGHTERRADFMLGVQAGGQYWLVDAGTRTREVPMLSPVPLTRPWFRGLAVIDGDLRGVVDLSAFQGGAPTPITFESCLLLPARPEADDFAVLVGSVVGERRCADLVPANEPPDDRIWAGVPLRDGRNRVWQVINLAALIRHPEIQDICA